MSCSSPPPEPPDEVLTKLKAATSAEDFFTLLGVPYDPRIVNVARLHILKRMAEYLASEDVEGLPNRIAGLRCKAVLERAYDDFRRETPLDARVFKVLKRAVEPPKPAHFVPLDVLLK